jgi:hypothetical protein
MATYLGIPASLLSISPTTFECATETVHRWDPQQDCHEHARGAEGDIFGHFLSQTSLKKLFEMQCSRTTWALSTLQVT